MTAGLGYILRICFKENAEEDMQDIYPDRGLGVSIRYEFGGRMGEDLMKRSFFSKLFNILHIYMEGEHGKDK